MTEAPVTYRGTVYPWQCDHIGHLNVMWYVGKFDEATWTFFADVGLTPGYLRERNCGMAAVQQNIAYKRELMAGDTISIRTVPLEVRGRVIRYRHDMMHEESGALAASCELTVVHLDRATRKASALPAVAMERLRAKLADAS
jgi:acyl-CoA thioester hydrolase